MRLEDLDYELPEELVAQHPAARREDARLDAWMKDIAPSTELRQWFGHEPSRWVEFQRRYKAELRQYGADLDRLRGIAAKGTLTLVYGARDEAHNDAVVLREVLLHGG